METWVKDVTPVTYLLSFVLRLVGNKLRQSRV